MIPVIDLRLVPWVALGGAVGAVLRYGVGAALTTPGASFPYATLVVNVVGTFLLALLVFYDLARGEVAGARIAFLGIGLLGAFTTMSALGTETVALYAAGAPGRAALSALLNLTLSVAAAVAGRALALTLAPPS